LAMSGVISTVIVSWWFGVSIDVILFGGSPSCLLMAGLATLRRGPLLQRNWLSLLPRRL
jgi:hypothetical protein